MNSSKLLIDEHPLMVLPSLASKVGLDEAIFLQQLHYWLLKHADKDGHTREGEVWVWNTYEGWCEQFGWWKVAALRRIVGRLRELELVETTTRFNRMAIDNTLWYRIRYDVLEKVLQNGAGGAADFADGADGEEEDEEEEEKEGGAGASVEIDRPSVEIDRPSVEISRPSAEISAWSADFVHTNNQETSSGDFPQETSSGNGGGGYTPDTGGVYDLDHARAHARELGQAGLDRHQAVVAAALTRAGVADVAGVVEAWPEVRATQVLAWNTFRDVENLAGGRMGVGVVVKALKRRQEAGRAVTAESWRRFLEDLDLWVWEDEAVTAGPGQAAREVRVATGVEETVFLPDGRDAGEVWRQVLGTLRLTLNAQAYDAWLARAWPVRWTEEEGLVVGTPTQEARDMLQERLARRVGEVLAMEAGEVMPFCFEAQEVA